MKKEHNALLLNDMVIPDNIPYKNNLILYAPLKDGDLRNYVNGENLICDSGCTYTWDNSLNAIKFQLPSSLTNYNGCYYQNTQNVWNKSSAQDIEFSIMLDVYFAPGKEDEQIAFLKTKTGSWTISIHRDGSDLRTWQRLIAIKQIGTDAQYFYESKRTTTQTQRIESGNLINLYLISSPSWHKANDYVGLKNAIFWNKALTLSEIQAI